MRKDFPRPGEDVTVGDKKGNLAKPSGFAREGEDGNGLYLPFTFTTLPVKKQFRKIRRFS